MMVASDVFLNPKHAGQTSAVLPKVMNYLGTKLGMTLKDLKEIAPKLASQVAQALGSSSDSSRKRKTELEANAQSAPAAPEKKRRESKEKSERKRAKPL